MLHAGTTLLLASGIAAAGSSTVAAGWEKPVQQPCTQLRVHGGGPEFDGTYKQDGESTCNGRALFTRVQGSMRAFFIPVQENSAAVWALGRGTGCTIDAAQLLVSSLARTPDRVSSAHRWRYPQRLGSARPMSLKVTCTKRALVSRSAAIDDRKRLVSVDAEINGATVASFSQLQQDDLMAAIAAVLGTGRFAEITLGKVSEWEHRGVVVEVNVPVFGKVESTRMVAKLREPGFGGEVAAHVASLGTGLSGRLYFSRPVVSLPKPEVAGWDNGILVAVVFFLTIVACVGARQLKVSSEKSVLGRSKKYHSVAIVPSDDEEEAPLTTTTRTLNNEDA